MQSTTDYKIINIIEKYINGTKDIKKKNDALELLMFLKESLEFNSTIDWPKVYSELGQLYKNPAPYYISDIYTPEIIDSKIMTNNDIFVFGSNNLGKHNGGAAKEAIENYCAIYGQSRGLQGHSYAIVTLDATGENCVDTNMIEKEINEFLEFAHNRQELTFWVTKIGCGISGFSINDIAPLFANKVIPQNVILPKEFVSPLYWCEYLYSPSKNKFFRIKNANTLLVLDGETNSINQFKDVEVIRYLPSDIVISNEDDWKTATTYIINQCVNTL